MITLVLGGVKSGKSRFALSLFDEARQALPGGQVLVTGQARDLDFRARVHDHRMERDPCVPVVETGPDLPEALQRASRQSGPVLVDSLDFWLFLRMERGDDQAAPEDLARVLADWQGPPLILVSCETGLGGMPGHPQALAFARSLGVLNQTAARLAHAAWLVAAGLPLALKEAH